MIKPMIPMLLYLVTKLSYLVLFAHFRSTDCQQLLHLSRKYSLFVVLVNFTHTRSAIIQRLAGTPTRMYYSKWNLDLANF